MPQFNLPTPSAQPFVTATTADATPTAGTSELAHDLPRLLGDSTGLSGTHPRVPGSGPGEIRPLLPLPPNFGSPPTTVSPSERFHLGGPLPVSLDGAGPGEAAWRPAPYLEPRLNVDASLSHTLDVNTFRHHVTTLGTGRGELPGGVPHWNGLERGTSTSQARNLARRFVTPAKPHGVNDTVYLANMIHGVTFPHCKVRGLSDLDDDLQVRVACEMTGIKYSPQLKHSVYVEYRRSLSRFSGATPGTDAWRTAPPAGDPPVVKDATALVALLERLTARGGHTFVNNRVRHSERLEWTRQFSAAFDVRNPGPRVQGRAMKALALLCGEGAADSHLPLLSGIKDAHARCAVALSLAGYPDEQVTSKLLYEVLKRDPMAVVH